MGRIMNVFCESGNASVYNIREVNSSFAVASLDVMYTGENPNMSNISRKAVEGALPTLPNVPIVCNYDPENREIGGHDVEFVSDDDGNIRMRNLTVPCGVVTDHTRFSFQVKKDKYGVEHEYLVADGVVLWKRQEVYEYIVNDCNGVIPHSMEIDVTDGAMNKNTGYFDIHGFEFNALCLLGNVRPCFEGSQLKVYSANDMKEQISQMLDELKQCYSLIASASDAVDNIQTHSSKGGDMMHDEIMKLAEEFGIDVSTLDFSLEGMSIDDVRAKFEEMSSGSTDGETSGTQTEDNAASADNSDEGTDDGADTGSTENFELNRNITEGIFDAMSKEVIHYEWGDAPKYYLVDYDADAMMIYAESAEDWKIYGFKYAMDGDTVVVDWSSKSRMKWAIVEYDEGAKEMSSVASEVFSTVSSMLEDATSRNDELQAKLDEVQESFSALSKEVEGLREYKSSTEAASVFAMFSDMEGNEAFEALKQSVVDGTVVLTKDALEEKCYAIRGRMASVAKFSAEQKTPKIIVDDRKNDDTVEKPYSGIVEKYEGINY